MDIFCEQIVNKKRELSDYITIFIIGIGAIILTYIFILITMMFLQYFASFGLLLIVGTWYGAIYLIRNRNIEYEYILTNHELDIDRILAKRRRKHMCSINFKHIERCASIDSPEFNSADGRAVKNFAGDMTSGSLYFVDYTDGVSQKRVIFQPNKRILDGIKKANPRFVSIKEGDL